MTCDSLTITFVYIADSYTFSFLIIKDEILKVCIQYSNTRRYIYISNRNAAMVCCSTLVEHTCFCHIKFASCSSEKVRSITEFRI